MHVVKTEALHYRSGELDMIGHLARPADAEGRRPAILVFPEAFGLGAHARLRAERLAAEFGYVALACDLHGDARVHDDLAALMPLLTPLQSDNDLVQARILPAFEALTHRPEVDPNRIAAIGFCFGGTLCYELAMSGADIRAAIGFHSGLRVTALDPARGAQCRFLALIGADDPGIPPADRAVFEDMMREASLAWDMHLFGGVVHSFTDPAADARGMPEFFRYDERADAAAWEMMAALLGQVFV